MSNPKHRIYPLGTIMQQRSGYVQLKQMDGRWINRGRAVMQEIMGRELEGLERVYHKDGDRMNDGKDNLVIIRFSGIKFVNLSKSKVLYLGVLPHNQKTKAVVGVPKLRPLAPLPPAVRRQLALA